MLPAQLAAWLVEATPRGVRAALDAVALHMAPSDISYFKQVMRRLADADFGYATLADLPVEIVCMIAGYLSLDDIRECQIVSKRWRALFTSGPVVFGVCAENFPGVMELNPNHDPMYTLTRSIREYARPLPGDSRFKKFASVVWPLDHLNSLPEEGDIIAGSARWLTGHTHHRRYTNPIYNDGMIALFPNQSRSFLVDNLHTGKRGKYWLPVDPRTGNDHGRLWAVSRKLVVAEMVRGGEPLRQL